MTHEKAKPGPIQAGAAQVDITPQGSVHLAGRAGGRASADLWRAMRPDRSERRLWQYQYLASVQPGLCGRPSAHGQGAC